MSVLDLSLGANQNLLWPCQPACLNDPFLLSTRGTKYVMRHAIPDYRDVRQGMVIAVKLAFLGTVIAGIICTWTEGICNMTCLETCFEARGVFCRATKLTPFMNFPLHDTILNRMSSENTSTCIIKPDKILSLCFLSPPETRNEKRRKRSKTRRVLVSKVEKSYFAPPEFPLTNYHR